jgi:hypothetical protein
MLPPVHVSKPLIATVSVPASVPPLWLIVVAVIVPPVEKFAVPPVILIEPTELFAIGVRKFSVPDDAVTGPMLATDPLKFVTPPLPTVAPVTL